ncbi:MAG: hypothetical protein AAFX44_04970 [Pseudomonadota bacterium]
MRVAKWASALAVVAIGAGAAMFWAAPNATAPNDVEANPAAASPGQVPAAVEAPPVAGESSVAGSPEYEAQTEIVMGIEVLKDRNCDVKRHYVDVGNGTVVEAFSCEKRASSEPDEYEHYTTEELKVLAYDTAGAAVELGKRLHSNDPHAAKQYMLRAVALQPETVAPINWLAAASFSSRGESKEAREDIANNYILNRVAQQFDPRVRVDWLIQEAYRAGLSDADIALFDELAKQDLRRIRDIQLEVTGETSVDEIEL